MDNFYMLVYGSKLTLHHPTTIVDHVNRYLDHISYMLPKHPYLHEHQSTMIQFHFAHRWHNHGLNTCQFFHFLFVRIAIHLTYNNFILTYLLFTSSKAACASSFAFFNASSTGMFSICTLSVAIDKASIIFPPVGSINSGVDICACSEGT